MHAHEIDPLIAKPLHLCHPRREEGERVLLYRAIAAGRADVLGAASLLRLQRTSGNTSVVNFLHRERQEERPPAQDRDSGQEIQVRVQRHIKNKNYVDYGGTNAGGTGTTMEAELWPGYSPGKGGAPSVEPIWWPSSTTATGAFFKSFMVQGHLLNQKLGGPGNTMDNLTPITKSANTMHEKKIEGAVKNAVGLGKYVVDYHVDADYSYHPEGKEIAPNETGAVQKQIDKKFAKYLPGQIIAEFTAWGQKAGKWTNYGDRWKIGNEAKEITS